MYIRRKVKKGTATGRKIGFPTLNFNVGQFGDNYGEGVYIAEVKIADKLYNGALFFGPRLHSRIKVLEIYVIGFNKMIYGQFVRFCIVKKIRNPKMFKSLDELKKQIEEDVKNV
jgi:riboflavin kinase / FMN adenylyltransferase